MKKKFLFILIGLLVIIIIAFGSLLILSRPVSKTESEVTFVIDAGTNKIEIVSNLKDAGIIRSKLVGLTYVFLTPSVNLQAGTYYIDKSSSTKEIIKQISKGNTNEKIVTVSITFQEGKKITDYAKLISNNFDITYDEIIDKFADEEFLNKVIDKYWFIDDIVLNKNIYYSLEGYLFPDTYEFYQDADIETILFKMLDEMGKNLEPLKNKINLQKYSIHDILTIASICEGEARSKEDREGVSQVVYSRLDLKMSLGMDATSSYGARKNLKDGLTVDDLSAFNDYNTRNNKFIGLPIGPICSPSLESIEAALNPSDTDYLYFYSLNGKNHFFKTSSEFYSFVRNLG